MSGDKLGSWEMEPKASRQGTTISARKGIHVVILTWIRRIPFSHHGL